MVRARNSPHQIVTNRPRTPTTTSSHLAEVHGGPQTSLLASGAALFTLPDLTRPPVIPDLTPELSLGASLGSGESSDTLGQTPALTGQTDTVLQLKSGNSPCMEICQIIKFEVEL